MTNAALIQAVEGYVKERKDRSSGKYIGIEDLREFQEWLGEPSVGLVAIGVAFRTVGVRIDSEAYHLRDHVGGPTLRDAMRTAGVHPDRNKGRVEQFFRRNAKLIGRVRRCSPL